MTLKVSRLLALLVVVLVAVWAPVAWAATARVSVTRTPVTRPMPSGFVGLALEYNTIPRWMGVPPATGAVAPPGNPVLVQLIRNLAPTGRPSLRIGGQSTDRSWWPVPGVRQPRGVTYSLTPQWTAAAHALAQGLNAQLLPGINLEANRTRIAQTEADNLVEGIGRQYVDALEIGNEPDLYPLVPWYREQGGRILPWYAHAGTPVYSRRPTYGPSAFAQELSRMLAVVPNVPIAGPETGGAPWLGAFSKFLPPRSRVRMLTSHDYGLNQCVTDPAAPAYPSVPHLLSTIASRGPVADIGPYVSLIHRAGGTYRLDEVGSVSCNGRAGVSNSMASALWVLDALFAAASQGVDGVNLHTYPGSVNGLFDLSTANGQWQATVRPLYYGALMFAQSAPAGSRLARLSAAGPATLRVWATLGPGPVARVVAINDSLRSAATVQVTPGFAAGPGSVERLEGPSAYATSGVTLGGQSFGATTSTGVLPTPTVQTLAPGGGRYTLTLPAASAAMLTLPLR